VLTCMQLISKMPVHQLLAWRGVDVRVYCMILLKSK
jgi:hypothetical protein